MLDQMLQDTSAMADATQLLPPDLRASLFSPEFAAACDQGFTDLDADGNGVLTVDELTDDADDVALDCF